MSNFWHDLIEVTDAYDNDWITSEEAQERINDIRAKRGLPPLGQGELGNFFEKDVDEEEER